MNLDRLKGEMPMTTYTNTNEANRSVDTTIPVLAGSRISPLDVLKIRNFRLLWIGESISLIGDQFYLIALPWLVLQLTGNALAVGTVLATAGIPRALFMLLGGALTDRFTPRRLMISSNLARMTLTGLLAGLVVTDLIQLWMLYAFALLFGLADAFFFPAQTSIVPQLVEKEQLPAGNAMIQGTATLSLFAGPVLAGVMIAWLDAGSAHTTAGIALAFALDALSFLASVSMLSLMRIDPVRTVRKEKNEDGVLKSIRAGLLYVWNDDTLRIVFGLIAAINLLIVGPTFVGVPVIASLHFPQGAAAFGLIMSVFGGGSFLGIVLAGALPKPSPQRLGSVLLSVMSVMGIGLVVIGLAQGVLVAALAAVAMGAANGYNNIMLITWLQGRISPSILGRIMSLVMFAAVGLNPISTALAGALIRLDPTALLVATGSLMTIFTLSAAFSPAVRKLGM
jgi:hypothetical protein